MCYNTQVRDDQTFRFVSESVSGFSDNAPLAHHHPFASLIHEFQKEGRDDRIRATPTCSTARTRFG